MIKTVDEKTFKDCCDLMLSGKMHPDVCAYLTGLSRPTFILRANQYYEPENFGPLPENFFDGKKDVWKENKSLEKFSPAVQKYLERQEAKKRRQMARDAHEKYLKQRNTFKKAKNLPKLED